MTRASCSTPSTTLCRPSPRTAAGLLDPAYDPFASFAAKYPEFAAWRAAHAKEELKAADGTSYPIHAMVLAEAREPTRAGNIQCEARVITLAEEMAEAALFAMRDPRRSISSMLVSQGGKFAVGADPGRNAATAGAHATNDRVESNFGCLDILMRMWRHATVVTVSGMAQQMRMHDFDRPPNTLHDRRKRKHAAQAHSGGYFYSGLTERQRESLVEFARLEVASARDAGRQALKAQAAEKLERREERVTAMLNKAVERYAYAKELFLPVRRRPRRTGSELRPRCRWPRRCTTGSRCRTTRTAGLSRRRSSSSTCATRLRCACSASAGVSTRLAGRPRPTLGSAPSRT